MKVTQIVGLRYARSRSANRFASVVSMVSFFGMVLGVVALIVVVSVMNGFDRELKQRILGAVPHMVAVGDAAVLTSRLDGFPVESIAPFQEEPMLLMNDRGSRLITVYGMDPVIESDSLLTRNMSESSLLDAGNELEVVPGASIARQFGLIEGDIVRLIIPVKVAGSARVKPQIRRAKVTGTFRMGSEVDHQVMLMHIQDVHRITTNRGQSRITLGSIFDVGEATAQLRAHGIEVTDWTEQYGDFFRTVRLEKIMMFVLLSFVIAVAAFSIVSGLSMMVDSKRRDIAVLRTMGLSERGVAEVFLIQGAAVALLGTLVGLLLGLPLAWFTPEIMGAVERAFGFSIVAGTYFDQIPVDIRPLDVSLIVLVASMIGLLATIYPSMRAARLHPAEILRYE